MLSGQGNFLEWYASNAFGGANYSNTPIAAVSHVDEPGQVDNQPNVYFRLLGGRQYFRVLCLELLGYRCSSFARSGDRRSVHEMVII